jgi:hypothetical protein
MKKWFTLFMIVFVLLFIVGCGEQTKTLTMEVIDFNNLDIDDYYGNNGFAVNTNDYRILLYDNYNVHYTFNIGDKIVANISSWYSRKYYYEVFKINKLIEVNGIKINNEVESE